MKRNYKKFKETHGITEETKEFRKLKRFFKPFDEFDKKDFFEGNNESNGMTRWEIEHNLQLLISNYKTDDQKNLLWVENVILDLNSINNKLDNWLKESKQIHYAAIIELKNDKGSRHAVLLKSEKLGKAVEIEIVDPLSKEDSAFIGQMDKLVASITTPGIIHTTYSGRQDKEYGTCGDMSLIALQELLEHHLVKVIPLKNTSSTSISSS